MKKIILIVIVAGISLTGLFNLKFNLKPSNNSNENSVPIPDKKDDDLISKMTIEEKIGQMLIVSYRKPIMDDDLKNILTTTKAGGFIFFSENFSDFQKTTQLIKDISDTLDIPPFLAIDQEGGRVQRLKTMNGVNIKNIPAMYEVGATNDVDYAYNVGREIALDLKKFGINLNFAPVMDVYSNPKNTVIGNRSFGSDPYLVSKMALSLGKGLLDNGITPVYKHFPGHGDTEVDSHVALPIVNKTKSELMKVELVPFIEAINNNAEVIMVGHLAVPSITGDYKPASLSKEVITDLLKNELGYKNLVVTDALNMKAITDNYTDKEIYELAINAGVDILLMPNNQIDAIKTIRELLNEGKITEKQIDIAVTKILNLKAKMHIINF